MVKLTKKTYLHIMCWLGCYQCPERENCTNNSCESCKEIEQATKELERFFQDGGVKK